MHQMFLTTLRLPKVLLAMGEIKELFNRYLQQDWLLAELTYHYITLQYILFFLTGINRRLPPAAHRGRKFRILPSKSSVLHLRHCARFVLRLSWLVDVENIWNRMAGILSGSFLPYHLTGTEWWKNHLGSW